MMQYRIDFSEEKNLVLQEARGIGFEEVVEAIGEGNIVADFHHKKYKEVSSSTDTCGSNKSIYICSTVCSEYKERSYFFNNRLPEQGIDEKIFKKVRNYENTQSIT